MGKHSDTSRREFLRMTGSTAGLGITAIHWPMLLALGQTACTARDTGAAFTNMDAPLAAGLAAIASQIVPSIDGPGAAEAGVIHFIDQALGGFMAGAKPSLEQGLAELNDAAGQRFAELDFDSQLALLSQHDQTPFFSTLRFLTVVGMFAMPAHGGNRDQVGWQLLGFESVHGWAPPFGHYDAGEHDD